MIVRGGTGLKAAWRHYVVRNWRVLLVVLLIEVAVWAVYDQVPMLQHSAFSAAAVGVLATVVGIFLAFRFNEAYSRWWEARTLWGGMVNVSRTFTRQVIAYLQPGRVSAIRSDETASLHREFVYRHLAYINALRLSLREQAPWPEAAAYLDPAEAEALALARSVPTQLMQRQADRLAETLGSDVAEQILLTHLDDSLTEMTSLQGGMERINNTAFPDRVVTMTKVAVWSLAVLIPLAFVQGDPNVYPLSFIATAIIVLSFFLVKQLGDELTYPFDELPNDTPMSALCRTIEIDLRQQLGEEDLPNPLRPVDGVLM